ncbi:MAG: tripartite tricarboxylate transporter substrate binding protein [Polaromonas sp.]|uniref:Bug family tripartite tricarboxylate transporter substrate binding protein n=1 Tax=Polaromonas sp. TaxID=1869339 RepID=UPI0025FB9CF1|nr:tripartite tricarboxylate transporter substrate binding protein [Polaromonas sp.]MBI2726251.1 tripartite tricarboxylate transporter substrate binding protein [Polaromonas sp.]
MSRLKRTVLKIFLAIPVLVVSLGALAQVGEYPTGPVRIVVPFPPGGPSDVLARVIGQKLSVKWGQPVLIDNRPGGLTVTGALEVKRAPADGSVILTAIDATYAINPFIFTTLPYSPMEDFEHVSLIATQSAVLLTNKTAPAQNLQGLIEYAKKNPGALNYAAATTSLQLAGALFDKMAGVKTTMIPYKGNAEAAKAILSGEVHFSFDGIAANAPHIKSGTLHAIATTGLKRSPSLPDVPTLDELGLKGFELRIWNGFSVPKKTPKAVIDKIQRDTKEALNAPDVKEKLLALGLEVVGSTPGEFMDTIKKDSSRYQPIIKDMGLKVQ